MQSGVMHDSENSLIMEKKYRLKEREGGIYCKYRVLTVIVALHQQQEGWSHTLFHGCASTREAR